MSPIHSIRKSAPCKPDITTAANGTPTTTGSTIAGKPSKPYADFPLGLHASGQWCKRIKGTLYYFGTDPDAALAKYLAEKDDLYAGKKPRIDPAALTVKDACNAFLDHKEALLNSGEISSRTWLDYQAAAELVIMHFGKRRLVADLRSDDFASLRNKLAKSWGPVTLGNTITRIRSIFKYAADNDLATSGR